MKLPDFINTNTDITKYDVITIDLSMPDPNTCSFIIV